MIGKLAPYLVLVLDAAFCLALASLWFGMQFRRILLPPCCRVLALPMEQMPAVALHATHLVQARIVKAFFFEGPIFARNVL
jgi:hypothetical protein